MDEKRAEISRLFQSADIDGSGYLSRAEIERVMTTLANGRTPSSAEVEECFRNMDMDKNGFVDQQEFIKVLLAWLGPLSHTPSSSKRPSEWASPVNELRKRISADIVDFFHHFTSDPEFQKEQCRRLCKTRNEFYCETLRFGFRVAGLEAKAALTSRVFQIYNAGAAAEREIQTGLMSTLKEDVLNSLTALRLLLSVVEVFSTEVERREHLCVVYGVFNLIVISRLNESGYVLY